MELHLSPANHTVLVTLEVLQNYSAQSMRNIFGQLEKFADSMDAIIDIDLKKG